MVVWKSVVEEEEEEVNKFFEYIRGRKSQFQSSSCFIFHHSNSISSLEAHPLFLSEGKTKNIHCCWYFQLSGWVNVWSELMYLHWGAPVRQHVLTVFAFAERGQALRGLQRQLLHLVGHCLALGTGHQQAWHPTIPLCCELPLGSPGIHPASGGAGWRRGGEGVASGGSQASDSGAGYFAKRLAATCVDTRTETRARG